MCGIFGYLFTSSGDGAAETPGVTVTHVVDTLLGGLQRLEYRGYDSAGICIDSLALGASKTVPLVVKSTGKITALRKKTHATLKAQNIDTTSFYQSQVGIGHTRWATHGPPSDVNSHPHVSSPGVEFAVVHNGIISNYSQLRTFLTSKGHVFESETDTEVVPKLLLYLYKQYNGDITLPELAMEVMLHLEGAFALLIKSSQFYPGELLACKRGSPLVYTVKQLEESAEGIEGLRKVQTPFAPQTASQVWLASDAAALLTHSRQMTVLDDEDLLHISADGALAHYNLGSLKGMGAGALPGALRRMSANMAGSLSVTRVSSTVDMELESVMKGGYDHYMQKEIHEQPKSLSDTITGRVLLGKPLCPASLHESLSAWSLPGLGRQCSSPTQLRVCSSPSRSSHSGSGQWSPPRAASVDRSGSDDGLAPGADWPEVLDGPTIRLGGLLDHVSAIRACRRLLFIACGTSYHACLAARATLEEFACMPVVLELAGDFMDREAPIFRDDTCVFVSQSGETADTLRALDYAKSKGALCVGITNTVGSAISHQTHCGVHLNAGFEIGVASTKAYTSQVVALTMMALLLGEDSRAKESKRVEVIRALHDLPNTITETLQLDAAMKQLAEELKEASSLLFFGRGYNYATALEAALKVKEVALIHSEGINAGEMKHGPLALVDEHLPIVVLATRDNMHRKMDSVIQQLLARNAKLYIVCNAADPVMSKYRAAGCRLIEVPHTANALQPVVNVVPLQLLSYHLTTLRGFDVDQPRNLAKSVTVTEE